MAAVPDPAGRLRAGIAAVMKQVSDTTLATETRAVMRNATTTPPGASHVTVTLVDSLAELFAGPAGN